MTKPSINQLGAVGLMIDGDPTMLPDAAFTDALNVRFNGREIAPYLGNVPAPYYMTMDTGAVRTEPLYKLQSVIFDGFSNGSSLLFALGYHETTNTDGTKTKNTVVYQQNMGEPSFAPLTNTEFPPGEVWPLYKGQINNCPFFGREGYAPIGKQYDWVGFDSLPSWGEQTGGDQVVVERRWTCKNMVSFDNRLLALNTAEETTGGVDLPYPNRIRWSGFAQENALPINWDDTAANRTPEEFAAAVIDGYAGWQDLSSGTQIIDACENGGTLYVYTERETFSLTPSGNDQAPFVTKLVYSDLGCLDIGCCVNAHGYNYVFTGSDIARHDSVSWKSIADGYCRDWLSAYVDEHEPGMVRMMNYPELSEIWVMCYGTSQAAGDYAKTFALAYNYVKGTWSRKTLPYIYDACFLPLPPARIAVRWDENETAWDAETAAWDEAIDKVSQGAMVGSCAAGGLYYLNWGEVEYRHVYSNGVWAMQQQPLQCYVERLGLEFDLGGRYMITETYLNGKGTNDITIALARADNPDAGYTWESQTANLSQQRRNTWRAEGEAHGYRFEISGQGSIPVGVKFTIRSTGR